jgi:integrase
MSGPRARYLSRRGAVYQIRLPVPKPLHARFGCREIRRSLHTKDYLAAKRRISPTVLAFQNICFRLIYTMDAPTLSCQALIVDFYRQLDAACAPSGKIPADQIDHFHHDQQGFAEDERAELELELQSRAYSEKTVHYVKSILAHSGLAFDQIGALERAQLLEGVVRAQIEQTHLIRHRQVSVLDPYEPKDELFRASGPAQLIAHKQSSATENMTAVNGGGAASSGPVQLIAQGGFDAAPGEPKNTVEARISQYLATEQMEDKTRNEKRVVLDWFAKFVGPSTSVVHITNNHMVEFRSLLVGLRKHTPASADLKKSQAASAKGQVSAKTAKKKFDTVKRFMTWLDESGFIPALPYKKLSVNVPAQPKSQLRRPFNAAELDVLFSSPIYSGCKSLKRRTEPGPNVYRDDLFWLPLLLHYTGMRLAELVLLPASAVKLDSPHPHITLDASQQKLKTKAAERLIPIHPDLLDFGFGKFVGAQQKQAKHALLFSAIATGSRPQDRYSKHFGRWLDKLGLTDRRLVAHSFRHGFVDTLRNAGVNEGEIQQIIGHETGSVTSGYGHGAKLEVLHKSVAGAEFGLSSERKQSLRLA